MPKNNALETQYDSPVFTYRISSVLPANRAGTFTFDFTKLTGIGKYTPLDYLLIENSSDYPLFIKRNYGNEADSIIYVPAGVIAEFDKKRITGINQLSFYCDGSADIPANTITVSVKKEPKKISR